MRYHNPFRLRALFYGRCEEEEKNIARKAVKANALNWGAGSYSVQFFDTPESARKAVL